MKRYGIFGGTFNPPHLAHSIVANTVRETLGLDKIIFIPTGNPPLKTSINAEQRLAMAKLAFSPDKNFEVSDIEINQTNEKSYTINTLQKLNEMYKNTVKLYLIIGIDNLIDFPNWKEPEKLFEQSEVIVINRPNFSKEYVKTEFSKKVKFVDVPMLEISSSKIRECVAHNKSIKYLVDKKVEEYIFENGLYK